MKKMRTLIGFIILMALVSGCGYTTSSLLPSSWKTIYIQPFKNKVSHTADTDRAIYFPLLEVNIREAIVNRFLFDGNLKIAKEHQADLYLKGELIGYDKDALRYSDDDDVEEYRIHITVNISLHKVGEDEPVWVENSFVGETTFFVTGPLAVPEATAVEDAITDLARRVVERTIENW